MDRLIIQALNMPIAGSFKTQADEGIKLAGSTSTQTSGSSNGSGYVYYGTYLYFSSAVLTFTGSLNEDETLYINNQSIQVINNQFTYDLNAPNVFNSELNNNNSSDTSTNNSTSSNNSSNSSTSITKTYNIEIYRNNVPIAGETIIITRGVPNVNFK
ncbi:hypothetical protein J6W34_02540 [bacterium]|nr:hypothetical protein [bacterium]